MHRFLAVLAVLTLGGCPSGPSADDGGPTDVSLGDAPPPMCEGDVICPLDLPYRNASCHTGLSCPYPSPGCTDPQVAHCIEDRWTIEPADFMTCSLGGAPLPEPERCRTPFDGTTSGTIAVTIDEAFAWGAQGGAMVPLGLTIEDTAMPLTCVEARFSLRVDGRAEPEARYGLRLRCGASSGMVVILSEQPCEMRPHLVEVTVEITGVGSASASAMLMGGQTSGPPICPMP